MPFKIGKAVIYAVLLWAIGFVWGSIVFMTPALKTVAGIPYVSSNPAISFPILFIWLIVTYLLAKSYLKAAGDTSCRRAEAGHHVFGRDVAAGFVGIGASVKAGFSYFNSLTVWLGVISCC